MRVSLGLVILVLTAAFVVAGLIHWVGTEAGLSDEAVILLSAGGLLALAYVPLVGYASVVVAGAVAVALFGSQLGSEGPSAFGVTGWPITVASGMLTYGYFLIAHRRTQAFERKQRS